MANLHHHIFDYIEEVEKCSDSFRKKIKEENNRIELSSKKISNLLNSFSWKEDSEDVKNIESMRVSLPNHSVLDSLFKEDSPNTFLPGDDREEKRKKLAVERRAEYNSYLQQKERENQSKRKALEEMSTSSTPRSLLESVDYDTILAKRREEELKFRQIHHAEPSISNGVNNSESSTPRRSDTSDKIPLRENNLKYTKALPAETGLDERDKIPAVLHNFTDIQPARYGSHRPLSNQENHFHRTGGGGEPVKDSFGNLITARGFRDIAPSLSFPSYHQDHSSYNKSSYREDLAKQIEEKKRLAALEKEKAQELENRVAQRIAEQRRQMQLEYENELKSSNKVKEQRQQERLRQLEEFQRRDAEMRERLKASKAIETRPKTKENANEVVIESRSSSPPIPAVRSKIIFEKVASPVFSHPHALSEVPVKPENIFSSLAEIRKKIMQDQQNKNRAVKGTYEVVDRRTVYDDEEDDYDVRGISEQLQSLKA